MLLQPGPEPDAVEPMKCSFKENKEPVDLGTLVLTVMVPVI